MKQISNDTVCMRFRLKLVERWVRCLNGHIILLQAAHWTVDSAEYEKVRTDWYSGVQVQLAILLSVIFSVKYLIPLNY